MALPLQRVFEHRSVKQPSAFPPIAVPYYVSVFKLKFASAIEKKASDLNLRAEMALKNRQKRHPKFGMKRDKVIAVANLMRQDEVGDTRKLGEIPRSHSENLN